MVVTTSFTEERIALGDLGRNLVASAVEFADLETPRAVLDHLDGLLCPVAGRWLATGAGNTDICRSPSSMLI